MIKLNFLSLIYLGYAPRPSIAADFQTENSAEAMSHVTGSCLPERLAAFLFGTEPLKQSLVPLAQRFDVAIIEDDIYGDLAFTTPRPKTLKASDGNGRVLLCSGFSKALSPGCGSAGSPRAAIANRSCP